MSHKTRNRRVMTNAARRVLRNRVNRLRTERDQIVAVVSRGERWWHYSHEQALTGVAREEIGAALHEFMAEPLSGEVPRTGNDIETMYHAGFYLSAAWLIFSSTEAYELREVFDKHRVRPHHEWWISDGWGAYHDTFGVKCPDCGGFTYAIAEPGSSPAKAAWPEKCVGCHAALPKQHHTDVYGGGEAWWADCACGWELENAAKAERYAKGQATRHLKRAAASAELVAA
jgi:hypothetical protein